MSLTNTQYDEIMRVYQARQLAHQRTVAARKEELASRSPELARIDGEIAHLSVTKARRLLSGDESALLGMREEIQALSNRKKAILAELGYPANYFEPDYVCPDCQDTGYIGNQKCHCLKQASIDLVYAQSNLQNILDKENFSNFSLSYYSNEVFDPDTQVSSLAAAQHAYTKCLQFVKDFDSTFENILLFGYTGVGKTFLSNCIAKELLDTGHSVIYFSASQLFDLLADNAFHKEGTETFDTKNILECDLLIIDDLGTELVNSFTVSQFFMLLNERILHQKSTLISTNLDLNGIQTIYSERVSSRIISSYALLHLFGDDIRVQKTLQGL